MPYDYSRLRPSQLVRVLNGSKLPDQKPVDIKAIRRHVDLGGFSIGEDGRIHLLKYAAWLRQRANDPMNVPEKPLSLEERYETVKEAAAAKSREKSKSGRDIGPIPAMADPARRARCRWSFREFCETYNPETFYWGWSDDHLTVIKAIEQSVWRTVLQAIAMPRGSGKSALCRMAVLWAIAYGHSVYPFLIGANEQKAEESLEAIKGWIQGLPDFVEDFPEISFPIISLENIASRAPGQLCMGKPTRISWGKGRVVLPTVPVPSNWSDYIAECEKIREDFVVSDISCIEAPTSGIIVGVSGLTGEGIRGSLFSLPNGKSIRPDLILLDDPQTDESAGSPVQNDTRFRLITRAVLGMAGPGKRISALMPCTVIRPGDMCDRVLDRKKCPQWRGIRTKMLRTMPSNMAAWEKYFDVYRESMGRTIPDIAPANEYYIAHRTELDAGAVASWEQRKGHDEVSAVQHSMNLYCDRGKEAFFAEYQNDPTDAVGEAGVMLTADEIVQKLSGIPEGVVPIGCNHLTAFIDIHLEIHYYVVLALEDDFTGSVITYGTNPKQPVRYFSQSDPPIGLSELFPDVGPEGAIYSGLETLVNDLAGREWMREDGVPMRIGRLFIDKKWHPEIVNNFCRRSVYAPILMPAEGRGIGPTSKPLDEYHLEPGGAKGFRWFMPSPKGGPRKIVNDVNFWKTFLHGHMALGAGSRGGLSLFGNDPNRHRLFSDHLVAEFPIRASAKYKNQIRVVDEWKSVPSRDNHFFDCFVGALAASSYDGCRLTGTEPTPKIKRVKFSDLQKMKRGR